MGDFFLIMTQPFCNFCIYKVKQKYKMKKIIALIGIFLLVISCNTEDDEPNVRYELLPIETVVIPDTLLLGDENIITVKYLQPTTCHEFRGFYYEKKGLTRTVAVETSVTETNDCQNSSLLVEKELKIVPLEAGTYTFKFWQGKDSAGNNIFLEFERPAIIN